MSIPELFLDNPIDLNAIPDAKLSINLPARLTFDRNVLRHLRWRFLVQILSVAVFIFCVAFIFAYFGFPSPGSAQRFFSLSNLLAFVLAIFAVVRPMFPYRFFGNVLTITAIISVGLMSALGRLTPNAEVNLQVVTYLELWSVVGMEIAIFYWHLAFMSSVETTAEREETRRNFRSLMWSFAGGLLFLAIFGRFLTPLATGWGLSLIAFVVGAMRLKAEYRKPWRALVSGIESYLLYPHANELAPGQLASPAGNRFARTVLIGTVIASMIPPMLHEWASSDFTSLFLWATLPLASVMSIFLFVFSIVGFVIGVDTPEKAVETWRAIVDNLRQSENAVEKEAIFAGHAASDHSPVIYDRSLTCQHVHILGKTGSNKTSMALAPLIEQYISFGDASVIVLDLKGDSPELYYAAEAAVANYRNAHNVELLMKYFALENGAHTQAFNPMLTKGWTQLSILERSDILATCCGLAYGFDYARSFFTSANSAVFRETNLANPNALSFRQLHTDVERLLEKNDGRLHPEERRAGIHVSEVIGRLAAYEELNAIPGSIYDDAVIENRIELTEYFERPGVAYFKLPSTTSSIGAPSVARLILWFLIIAKKATKGKTKIHVIIDEAQRVASDNIDQMLQMARSHDISLVLCNQSMSDLKANSEKLFSAVDGNVGIRQWFTVSSSDDLRNVEHLMGTYEKIEVTESRNARDTTRTYRKVSVPRATVNDLHAISEHPNLSILQIGGQGKGYARYRGVPFVVHSSYHISEKEFNDRKNKPWPTNLEGMMIAKDEFPTTNRSTIAPIQTRPQRRRGHPGSGNHNRSADPGLNQDLFDET